MFVPTVESYSCVLVFIFNALALVLTLRVLILVSFVGGYLALFGLATVISLMGGCWLQPPHFAARIAGEWCRPELPRLELVVWPMVALPGF